jgi:hypothetical protein
MQLPFRAYFSCPISRYSAQCKVMQMSQQQTLPVVLHTSIPLLSKRFSIWSKNAAECAGLQLNKVSRCRQTQCSDFLAAHLEGAPLAAQHAVLCSAAPTTNHEWRPDDISQSVIMHVLCVDRVMRVQPSATPIHHEVPTLPHTHMTPHPSLCFRPPSNL